MNIYITRANQEWLRDQLAQGQSMSGIINRLVEHERGATSLEVAKESFAEAMSDHTGSDIRFVDEVRLGDGGNTR